MALLEKVRGHLLSGLAGIASDHNAFAHRSECQGEGFMELL